MQKKRRAVLFSLFSFVALAQNEKGKIVEVTKATPVFSAPQRAAKVIADADPGSAFTVIHLSPNKGWLYLMDEDGNKGWVPTQRTNYFVLAAPIVDPKKPQEQTKAKPDPKQQPKDVDKEEKPSNPYAESKSIFALVFRKGFQDPNGRYGMGVKVFVNSSAKGSGLRNEKMGLEAGYIQMLGQKNQEPHGYSIPLRYKMLNRDNGSSIVSGPDLGALFMKIRPPSQRSFWKSNLSIGYSFGWNPVGTSVFAWIRPGGEFFYHNRFSLEGNLSWLF